MFKVNDAVFYGVHGVCTVQEISKREFCGTLSDYYTLKPVYTNRSTVFVQVDRAESGEAGIRKVISKDEALRIIDGLVNCETFWEEDSAKRKELFADIIKNGTREKVAALIKTIYEQREKMQAENKKMYASDERALSEAEKTLGEEFAFVLDIPKEKVSDFIAERIGK